MEVTPQHLGNKDLLNRRLTAFLASRTVQTARVLACYDWATSLSAETDCVVSGFQSPIERDVLHFLMKKRIPVVVVLARAMYKQRKLTDEQTTFQQQLNATRLLLAKNYLKNSERTSDDIAFLLGYEDTTSFLRAFNVWTGMSITEYKKR